MEGRKFQFAEAARIEQFVQISSDFMYEIFDLKPGEYLISDESDVADFTDFGSSDNSEIWRRIAKAYGIDQSDVGSGRLVEIFAEIARRTNPH